MYINQKAVAYYPSSWWVFSSYYTDPLFLFIVLGSGLKRSGRTGGKPNGLTLGTRAKWGLLYVWHFQVDFIENKNVSVFWFKSHSYLLLVTKLALYQNFPGKYLASNSWQAIDRAIDDAYIRHNASTIQLKENNMQFFSASIVVTASSFYH